MSNQDNQPFNKSDFRHVGWRECCEDLVIAEEAIADLQERIAAVRIELAHACGEIVELKKLLE